MYKEYTYVCYMHAYTHIHTYLFRQWTPQASTNTDLALSGYSIIVLKTPNIKFPDLPELRIFCSDHLEVMLPR